MTAANRPNPADIDNSQNNLQRKSVFDRVSFI